MAISFFVLVGFYENIKTIQKIYFESKRKLHLKKMTDKFENSNPEL